MRATRSPHRCASQERAARPIEPHPHGREQLTPVDRLERTAAGRAADGTLVSFELLRKGMQVEREHGLHDLLTNVTDDDPLVTAKIALAHLNEFPDSTPASSGWSRRPDATSRAPNAPKPVGRLLRIRARR
jgi:uncharacterized protein YfiM (DUF2279 family)